ncbi:hypothetical protein [Petroclostridium xylanilyticum]|uniref:hypothetical protein n=1 Tax=Petroclostridium xylanilyticum TaxID=1792311 RepID=UPI0012FFC3E0|nr:hypothetical protein [Petroclostridium xylanilyticum]
MEFAKPDRSGARKHHHTWNVTVGKSPFEDLTNQPYFHCFCTGATRYGFWKEYVHKQI